MKTRIIAHSQQVVRADWESRADVEGPALQALLGTLERELPRCHGLIVSDYGKGVVTRAVLEQAIGLTRAKKLRVSVDPKESHIDSYRSASILTPNQHEAGYVMGQRIPDEASLLSVGRGLHKRGDADAVLITRGPAGVSLFGRRGGSHHVLAVEREGCFV